MQLRELVPIVVALIGLAGVLVQVGALRRRNALPPHWLHKDEPHPRPAPRSALLSPSLPVLLGAALLLVAGSGVALRGVVGPAGPPVVRVTEPAAGATVPMDATLRGTAAPLARGDSLWVVVYVPGVRRYFPQDAPIAIAADGGWSAGARVGGDTDTGTAFEVLAVAAGRKARAAFRDYLGKPPANGEWEGLAQLPEGAVEAQRIAVVRGAAPAARFVSPTRTRYVREQDPRGNGLIGIYGDGDRLLASVDVVQHPGGDVANPIRAVAWSPDEKLLGVMFHHDGGGHVSIVDAERGVELGYVKLGTPYRTLRFAPDGGAVVVDGIPVPIASKLRRW
jgi:hypothetical protein